MAMLKFFFKVKYQNNSPNGKVTHMKYESLQSLTIQKICVEVKKKVQHQGQKLWTNRKALPQVTHI
jgi:hypothetical protein